MTDKEKMQCILDNSSDYDSIKDLLIHFCSVFNNELSIGTVNEIRKVICTILDQKIEQADRAMFVANERAGYIKKYLSGKMWPTEKIAKEYLQPQIDNAQAIIDACGRSNEQ